MATESLAGKTAIVTGSTSGIGLGIAKKLASLGANLTVNGLGDKQRIDAAVQAVESTGDGQVRYAAADMRRPDEIARLRGLEPDEFLPAALWKAYQESERGEHKPALAEED